MNRLLRGPWALNPLVQLSLAALTFALGLYHLWLLTIATQLLEGNDFGKFYYAFHMWRHGQSLYAPTSATHMQSGSEWQEFLNMNPPHFHLLVWPFASLPLWQAAYYWWLINIGLAIVGVWIVLRELGGSLRLRYVFPWAVCILASGPAGAVTITNQFVGLLFLLTAVAWRSARRRADLTAGACLGILVSLKSFLGLFLPALAIRRQWRILNSAALAAALCFLVGVYVFGRHSFDEWVAAIQQVNWGWAAMNASWTGVLERLFTRSPFDPLTIAPAVIPPASVIGALIIGTLTLLAAKRSVDHLFAAVVLGALLISPLGWVYYIWLAAPPITSLWTSRPAPMLSWASIAILAVPFYGPPHSAGFGVVATLTLGSAFFWAVIAMWSSVVLDHSVPDTLPAGARTVAPAQ